MIDNEEQLVNRAVKALHITRVIIAHRPETIASANRAIVLMGGKVVQDVILPVKPAAAAENELGQAA